jgi:8-oxo-dGTP pyrophosphatase MutT (NUDIX family)
VAAIVGETATQLSIRLYHGLQQPASRVRGKLRGMRRERASAVCVHEGALLCVQMRDPLSQVTRLFVPGGGLGPGESPADAAARETLEETGYTVTVDPGARVVKRYPYVWAGIEIDVTTQFFRAQLASDRAAPTPVRDAAYNEGAVWLPLEQLEADLGFNPDILAAVRALLP